MSLLTRLFGIFYRIQVFARELLYMALRILLHAAKRPFLGSEARQRHMHDTFQAWARWSLRTMGGELRTEGAENLAQMKEGEVTFFVANHSSYTDIPALAIATQRVLGFVAKIELNRIPFLAFWMREIGCVFIDRKHSSRALRYLKALQEKHATRNLVLFPEGTRSKDGQIAPFKPGVLKIAFQIRAQIVPVLIVGTRDIWEERTHWGMRPVVARILPPIRLSERPELKFEEFTAELHALLVAERARLASDQLT